MLNFPKLPVVSNYIYAELFLNPVMFFSFIKSYFLIFLFIEPLSVHFSAASKFTRLHLVTDRLNSIPAAKYSEHKSKGFMRCVTLC
jgi:hypothetical protein